MDEHLEQHGAQLEHLAQFAGHVAYRSAFEEMLLTFLALAPRRDRTGTRDGRRAAMRQALDNRATYYQIRDWRQGHRSAPAWAWDLIEHKLAKRQNAIAAARSRRPKAKTAGD